MYLESFNFEAIALQMAAADPEVFDLHISLHFIKIHT
jgi:hypothetical protein